MSIIQTHIQRQKFLISDLAHWVWAFDQFIGDVRDLLPNPGDLPDQMDLNALDRQLNQEFEEDAEHQRFWWLHYDRAAEALPLLESDGPENQSHPVGGFGDSHMDYERIRDAQEYDAYINLVGANVDRKMGDLSGFKPNFYAEAEHPAHEGAVRVLNKWVESIKDNNNFAMSWNRFKREMISIGSGVLQFSHGNNWDNHEFALFRHYVKSRDYISEDEFKRFEDVFDYHSIKYIPSFHVVRYRGAQGPRSVCLDDTMHRQIHHFEHMSVSDARNRWPKYADKIRPNLHQKSLELSPWLSIAGRDITDMVTVIHHQIKFPVRERLEVPILGATGEIYYRKTEKPRYATGYITRVYGAGIVDMQLDPYNHGQFDMVQGVNFASSKHGCGIGMVKFGRDPAIIHNKLHNGAIRFFGRQLKGGGYYLDGVMDEDDIAEQSRGNRWVKVNLAKARQATGIQNVTLKDVIMDQRPPTFPSAWANLMQMEEVALDRSMRAGGAWKGERVGYSGLQQSLASQDAGLMHTDTHDILRFTVKEMSDKVFSNVIQFDGDRHIQFSAYNEHGELEQMELNAPQLPVLDYDYEGGQYKMVPAYIKNHIGAIQFVTKIEPESIVPERPVEKQNFYIGMLQFISQYINSREGRILLRGFQSQGLRIPGLDGALDQIDNLQAEGMRMQAQIEEIRREEQRMHDERDWAKNKAEIEQNLLRLTQKFVTDIGRSHPDTLAQILGGQYPQLQGQFTNAVQQLLSGTQANPLAGAAPAPQRPPGPNFLPGNQ